jgi:NTP pyrophosphatase (non-canonical NTP hydrolase)
MTPTDKGGREPEPLTLSDAQHAVDASIQALGGYWPPLAALARLFEEGGELARAVNQMYGPKLITPGEAAASLDEELGDVLYITLALANDLGLDAEEALKGALARSQKRATK